MRKFYDLNTEKGLQEYNNNKDAIRDPEGWGGKTMSLSGGPGSLRSQAQGPCSKAKIMLASFLKGHMVCTFL